VIQCHYLLITLFLVVVSLHYNCVRFSSALYVLPSHLRHTAYHSTSSPTSDSGTPELSTSVFLKQLKSHLFCISLPPSSVITWATLGLISLVLTLLGLFHFIVIPFHLIFTSFTHALLSWIRFSKCLRISLSLSCSIFVSTLNQLHSIRLFIQLISFFSLLISFILLLEQKVEV
jgi:hypothetical protein